MFGDIKSQMEEAANYARYVEAQRIERLRDEFAMAALTGFCSQSDATGMWSWLEDAVPAVAYRIADAMMEARK